MRRQPGLPLARHHRVHPVPRKTEVARDRGNRPLERRRDRLRLGGPNVPSGADAEGDYVYVSRRTLDDAQVLERRAAHHHHPYLRGGGG
jgi:hypothetical protein